MVCVLLCLKLVTLKTAEPKWSVLFLGVLHVKETLIENMLALEKLVLVSSRPGLTWESVGN